MNGTRNGPRIVSTILHIFGSSRIRLSAFVTAHHATPLHVVGGIGALDRRERGLLLRVVRRPDPVGALEGHVLEHVCEPRDPWHLAIAAHVHVREEGEDRRLGALAHENREPVRERLDAHLLLEGGHVLGAGWNRDRHGEHGEGKKHLAHRSSANACS
jgi:hypothetical protein